MRLATKQDKELVLRLLYISYKENSSVLWVVKNDHKQEERIKALFSYCFYVCLAIDGIYITEDNQGLAFLFPIEKRKPSIMQQLKVVFNAMGLKKGLQALKREKFIDSHRPNGGYLYFWMLAVDPEARGGETIRKIVAFCFKQAKEQKKDIYAETSIRQNKIVYERLGFETYYQWDIPNQDFCIWFLKRSWEDNSYDCLSN